MIPPKRIMRDCYSRKCKGESRYFELNGITSVTWKTNYHYTCRNCHETIKVNASQLEEVIDKMRRK